MENERLKQLLINCMNWIEEDYCDLEELYDTFEHLEFEPEEVEYLGFGYLIMDDDEEE